MSEYIDLAALGEVLLTSLVAGAGLVACFALGMVGWSKVETAPAGGALAGGRTLGWALAVLGFGAVAAGVVAGIWVMLHK